MNRPFDGLKVLDFSTNVAGPSCTAMLADFGADVVKVERPKAGDQARGFPPFVGERISVKNLWFNRGKRSIAMPFDDPEAVEVILQMMKTADVVVENYKVGTMKRFGLDYESAAPLNPGLIYCSISFYGQHSKDPTAAGFDVNAQALSGLMDLTGEPDGVPQRFGSSICDYMGGFNAFNGIVTALYHREKTGEGQMVDVGIFNGALAVNGFVESAAFGDRTTRTGAHHNTAAPMGTFQFRSGNMLISAPSDPLWAKLCGLMGRLDMAEDPRFRTTAERVNNLDIVVEVVTGWLNQFDSVEEAENFLLQNGIPCAAVLNTRQAIQKALDVDCGALVDWKVPESSGKSTIKARGPWIKLSKTPAQMSDGCPPLGRDSADILRELGYSEERVARLVEKWK